MTTDSEFLSSMIVSWFIVSVGLAAFISVWFHNYLQSLGVRSRLFSFSPYALIEMDVEYLKWRKEQGVPHTKEYKIRAAVLLNFILSFLVYSSSDILFST